MAKEKISEAELIKKAIPSLLEWGWEIYQEVEGCGGRVDIVCKRGNIQWAIEAKMSCGLAVIEQANNWRRWCHYTSILVPSGKSSSFTDHILRWKGIGSLAVNPNPYLDGEVQERVKPLLFRKAKGLRLHEEQKTFCEAGGNQGGHWTPFKRTCRELVRKVRQTPGIEFHELVKTLDHHYSSLSSAKSCLRGFIGTVIPELRIELVGGKLCVFLAEKEIEKLQAENE